jgi:hypothetical protein
VGRTKIAPQYRLRITAAFRIDGQSLHAGNIDLIDTSATNSV